MSKRSYENHALLYYFSSFARSKTSSYSYNPQNEMFARFGTKCYPTQNETFFF